MHLIHFIWRLYCVKKTSSVSPMVIGFISTYQLYLTLVQHILINDYTDIPLLRYLCASLLGGKTNGDLRNQLQLTKTGV